MEIPHNYRHPGESRPGSTPVATSAPVQDNLRCQITYRTPALHPCVYILASKPNGVLYIGVTSALADRMAQQTHGLIDGFTKRYDVKNLVYYEFHETMPDAIRREKQLKEWRRTLRRG